MSGSSAYTKKKRAVLHSPLLKIRTVQKTILLKLSLWAQILLLTSFLLFKHGKSEVIQSARN
jgi:hypothetical protein